MVEVGGSRAPVAAPCMLKRRAITRAVACRRRFRMAALPFALVARYVMMAFQSPTPGCNRAVHEQIVSRQQRLKDLSGEELEPRGDFLPLPCSRSR